MNFGRILNIFIILFLVANVVLYGMYEYKSKKDYSITAEKEAQLRETLGENDIYIYCLLPDFRPRKRIEVKFRNIDEDKIRKQLFGNVTVTYKNLDHRYTKENEDLIIYQGTKKGTVFYTNSYDNHLAENFDNSTIEKYSKDLMKKLTIEGNMNLTSYQPDDNYSYYQIEYNDSYRDETIFSNTAGIIFYESGKVMARVKNRYEPIRFVGDSERIYPIDEVLYKFMHNIRQKDNNELIKIMGIDIGYYVEEEDIADANTIMKAEPWYRIRLGNNEVHYINAYTNKDTFYTKGIFDLEDEEN
ncbi:hypothetical protein [Vallitalea guaymasensis]|uniref:Uncharacterized protein n=1 Tax=Vallitalea guaymasensis TaxID=1185412 RepID=A0A8J8MA38_9FIRM|nr:hypothetical protein [Vallitalea guaymasensis]QUH29142.1 hypothetical protein HYG85_09485 [Vallitalea guaymasensis]